MADRDYIQEVQARVGGCPHKFIQYGAKADPLFYCAKCDKSYRASNGLPDPSPDCSTLYGALQAAQRLGVWVRVEASNSDKLNVVGNSGMSVLCATERDACAAVCRIIVETLEKRSAHA